MAMYVVKVQFGESLRRLSLSEDVAFSFANVLGRTRDLFQIPANAQLVLTYVDRDGDVVTMAEDQDLQDALVLQSLNPLRVSAVILSNEASATTIAAGERAAVERRKHLYLQQQQMQRQKQQLIQNLQRMQSGEKQLDAAPSETEPKHHGVVESRKRLYLQQQQMQRQKQQLMQHQQQQLMQHQQQAQSEEKQPGAAPSETEPMHHSVVESRKRLYLQQQQMQRQKQQLIQHQQRVQSAEKQLDAAAPSESEPVHHSIPESRKRLYLQQQQMQRQMQQQVQSAEDKQRDAAPGETEPVHHGVVCNDCGVHNIRGLRYKSLKREDYDLCGRCFAKPGVDPNDYLMIQQSCPYRRSMQSSRHGCDSRNPNYHHHRHGSHHHIHSMHQRGKHGCPMGISGNGNFNGELVHDRVLAGTEAVHVGVTCDECNVCPIVGLRFKSIKKFNYDLCQVCMQSAGPGAADEYTRIDQPTQHLQQLMGKYYRAYPPYAPYSFSPCAPCGRSRCPRRDMGVMPREHEREVEASIFAGEVQMGIPVHPTGIADPMDGAAPGSSAENEHMEVLMVDIVGASDARKVPVQEQNGVVALAATEEVVMTEADGKDASSEKSFHSGSNERQEISVGQTPVQAEVTEKTQEDVSSYEGMVAKLASMGFTDDRLNEELLKKNNFDLRMTLDDLCIAEDWDTILEELQEMGFYDSDLNRRLLFQNNGSVKRVVKELVQMVKEEESSSVSKEGGKA